jgi:hypothetical protein
LNASTIAVTYSVVCADQTVPQKFESMATAITEACKLVSGGVVVMRINGSDGFLMERSDIEIECLRRQNRV